MYKFPSMYMKSCHEKLFWFSASSSNNSEPFQSVNSQVVSFDQTLEQYGDCCFGSFFNNTFTSKKKGKYKFDSIVSVISTPIISPFTGSITLSLRKNGTLVTSITQAFNVNSPATQTLNLCLNHCLFLCQCQNVDITVSTSISSGTGSFQVVGSRTFSGTLCSE
jgi:hypothetical protein